MVASTYGASKLAGEPHQFLRFMYRDDGLCVPVWQCGGPRQHTSWVRFCPPAAADPTDCEFLADGRQSSLTFHVEDVDVR